MILLPHGIRSKEAESLTVEEMGWLAMGAEILPKLNLTIACPRCLRIGERTGAALRGNNDPSDAVISVECNCKRREYRARRA